MARDIVLTNVYGIETGRATQDVDFAVAVANWNQFNVVKEKLVASGQFSPAEKAMHRLYYRATGVATGYPLDILPFRGVELPPNRIAWPPDMDEVMNVIGYEEALANIVQVEVAKGLVIPVTSLPGLALLKVFAWTDRGHSDSKDALDLVTLLRTYNAAGNEDRLYGEELRLLEDAGFDPVAASPQLLGKDVRTIAKPDTLKQILSVLNDANSFNRLVTHMAPRLRSAEDPIAAAETLLERFKAGLNTIENRMNSTTH
jgi:predicted nucleotidyltransferase